MTALRDKKPIIRQWSWSGVIFLAVPRDRLAGFRPQFNLSQADAPAQDGVRLVVAIDILLIQDCDCSCPDAGVKEPAQ